MNKKMLVILCSCVALVLLVLIGLIALRPNNDQPNGAETTLAETEASETTGVMETTEAEEETEATETTASQEETEATVSATEPELEAKPDNTPEQSTQPTTEPTNPTIPSDNVQMGTTEGEKDEGITDEDVPVITPSQPQESQPQESAPSGGSVLGDDFDITQLTYEGYHALTGEQQKAVIDLFGSPEDFMVWYNAVEAIYKAEHPDIEIGGDGSVDMG